MPFAAGVFSLVSGNPVVTGTTISSTWANTTLDDIASNGLSMAVLKDGSQTITGNIPMSGLKITGLGAATAATDAARLSQVQSMIGSNLTGVSGTNTIAGSATPTPAYAVGQRFTFVPANTNTGATTLNISSLGAGAVQWVGAALTGGELVAGEAVTVLVTAVTPVFEIIAPTQFPDTRALIVGGTDSTKKARFEVDGLTTGTTRSYTLQDQDMTIGPVLLTEQLTTSGTTKDFTIPTWAKEITLQLKGVSTGGTSALIVQLGDAGGIEDTSYLGAISTVAAAAAASANFTTGMGVANSGSAASVFHGQIVITLENASTFSWVSSAVVSESNQAQSHFAGSSKSLSAALTTVRLTTVSADTFDAGAVNVLYK